MYIINYSKEKQLTKGQDQVNCFQEFSSYLKEFLGTLVTSHQH